MKRMKFFGLILLMVLVACNQNMLGVGHGVKNFLSLPIDGISNAVDSITGNTYSSYRDETLEYMNAEEINDETINRCIQERSQSVLGPLSEAMGDVRDQVCTCELWGTCKKGLCDCETLCPNNLLIFRRPDMTVEDTAKVENSLPFRNDPEDFRESNHQMTEGYCWGHASVTSKFNRLAFFEKDSPVPHEEGSEEWKDYYEDIIDNVIDNDVQKIPGFANLNEFASHPDIKEMFLNKIPHEWATRAMSVSGLAIALQSGKMTPTEYQSFIDQVDERISMGQSPQVVFTKRDERFVTHALLVHEVKVINGKKVLCMRDNNYDPEINVNCRARMYLDRGELVYNGRKVGGIEVASNENGDTVSQLHSLVEHCKNERDCD
ncbi:MAG: hypothetical protein GY909_02240 [Oligoflexia bacterium]|nr:hypothetical protein [Oligoflexia bacterium]